MHIVARPLGFLVCLLLFAQQAVACACCAEEGHRSFSQLKIGEGATQYIQDLTENGPAWFVTGSCGTDCITGVLDPLFEYQPQLLITDEQIAIALSDIDGELRGTLVMELPDQLTQFAVDPEPRFNGANDFVFLEARMDVSLTGTGDFSMIKNEVAEFILSGFGNNCANAGSFDSWAIQVENEKAQFRLIGGLAVG